MAIDEEVERDFADSRSRLKRRAHNTVEPQCRALLTEVGEELAPVFRRQRFAEKFGELPQFLAAMQFWMRDDIK